MTVSVERFIEGTCNITVDWLGFLPLICIIVGLFCGDKPYRLLLRSLAFVLITLPVFFKFKNEEIALELFMVSIGSLALSTWYWFRVRKIPEFPEALRLAHKSLMARLSDRLKNKKSKRSIVPNDKTCIILQVGALTQTF